MQSEAVCYACRVLETITLNLGLCKRSHNLQHACQCQRTVQCQHCMWACTHALVDSQGQVCFEAYLQGFGGSKEAAKGTFGIYGHSFPERVGMCRRIQRPHLQAEDKSD